MHRPPLAVAFLILLSGLLLVIFGRLVLGGGQPPPANANTPLPEARTAPEVTVADPVRGNTSRSAPTIVVFGDYACPACRALEPQLTEIMQRRPDVRIVWKNVPVVTEHPEAQAAAEAALCAGRQGQYFTYHDALMSQDITADPMFFENLASQLGLDAEAFKNCTTNHTTAPLVRRTVEEALGLGLSGVPAIFVGGKPFNGQLMATEILNALPVQ